MLALAVGLHLAGVVLVMGPDAPPVDVVNRALDVAGATVIRWDDFSDPQATARRLVNGDGAAWRRVGGTLSAGRLEALKRLLATGAPAREVAEALAPALTEFLAGDDLRPQCDELAAGLETKARALLTEGKTVATPRQFARLWLELALAPALRPIGLLASMAPAKYGKNEVYWGFISDHAQLLVSKETKRIQSYVCWPRQAAPVPRTGEEARAWLAARSLMSDNMSLRAPSEPRLPGERLRLYSFGVQAPSGAWLTQMVSVRADEQSGEISYSCHDRPVSVGLEPKVTEADARATALKEWPGEQVKVQRTSLDVITDPRPHSKQYLAWRFDVRTTAGREVLWIDAHRGGIVNRGAYGSTGASRRVAGGAGDRLLKLLLGLAGVLAVALVACRWQRRARAG